MTRKIRFEAMFALGLIVTLLGTHVSRAYGADVEKGDVIVTKSIASLMSGQEKLATVDKGTRLYANNISKGWVSVTVPRDGKDIAGWIQSRYVTKTSGPKAMKPDRGLIIGRVTLDYDGFQGMNSRNTKPIEVFIARTDSGGKEKALMKVPADKDGYLYFENVEMDEADYYVIIKIHHGSAETPSDPLLALTFHSKCVVSTGYAGSSKPHGRGERVLDIGHTSLSVNSKGEVVTSHDATDARATSSSLDVSLSDSLERHTWFLKRFPKSDWATAVKADRDAVTEMTKKAE